MGERGGGRGGVKSSAQRGKMSRGYLLILVPTMLTIKMCVHLWERDTESEKENQSLNFSTQSSQQRHFHSRWSGSAAIWRPRWPDNLRYLQTQNFV